MDNRLKLLLDKAKSQIKRSEVRKPSKVQVQVKEKEVEVEEVKQRDEDEESSRALDFDENEILSENLVAKIEPPMKFDVKIPPRSENAPEKDIDEIKNYLNQLSKKTRIQETESKIEEKIDAVSDFDDDSLFKELAAAKIVKFIGDETVKNTDNNGPKNKTIHISKASTALQTLARYENKYLKSQPPKSHLLDSESDISLSDLSTIGKSMKKKPLEVKDKSSLEIIDPQSEAANRNSTPDSVPAASLLSPHGNGNIGRESPFLQLEDLHTVEELLETVSDDGHKTSRLLESSILSMDVKTIKSYDEVVVEEDVALDNHISSSNVSNQISSSKSSSISEVVESIVSIVSGRTEDSKSNSFKTKKSNSFTSEAESSSGHLLKNVHFDTVEGDENSPSLASGSLLEDGTSRKSSLLTQDDSSVLVNSRSLTSSSSSSEKPVLSKTKRYHPSSIKHSRTVATQANVKDNQQNFQSVMPSFDVNMELRMPSFAIAEFMLKQGKMEALAVSDPYIVALHEIAKEELYFSRRVLNMQRCLYVSQITSLEPDYHYTTWEDTVKEIKRKRERMKRKKKTKRMTEPTTSSLS